ncbi:MAG: hypothetical protein B7X04_03450 [Parcubacteria group bacterium 21-54-25]|nr:MAG: hypothetical protein B7X04_03450 [Parcubacteria group bacterium 21-54-25]HQU08017.1 hypothetical protein [Candidatus Paceibacterota bacterium]
MPPENQQVQFDEESQFARPLSRSARRSALVRLVINTHLAKDDQGAERVLLVIAVLAVIAALWIAFATFWAPAAPPPTLPPGLPRT